MPATDPHQSKEQPMATTTPSFELRITIAGLAILIPRPQESPPVMHVFLPECVHEPHFPLVWYDGAHENDHDPTDPHRIRLSRRLPKGVDVDFSSLPVSVGSVPNHLPPSIPCLSHATGKVFDLKNMKNVGSHLVLPRGGLTLIDALSLWDWQGTIQRLTGQVVWQIEVNAGSLKATPPLPPLYPKDGVIELFVANAIQAESTFPPPLSGKKPKPGTAMAHFDCYYDLYGDPPGARPAPIYQSDVAASTPYTCLPSGGH
jgi:hypothetical protein